jgi:uncharacterized protein (TIGR01615 family)
MVDFERDLLQDTKSLAEQCRSRHSDGRLDVGHLAEELGHLGYAVKVVTVDGYRATEADTTPPASGTTSSLVSKQQQQQQNHVHFDPASILEKLRHAYLLCTGKLDGSLKHDGCLVDPRFKEQFVIGHPTAAYEKMLTAVPIEFVGTRLRLDALVRAVCHEIAVVYDSQGLPLPPWRKEQALLSRWAAPVGVSSMGGGGGINLARDNSNNNNICTATDGVVVGGSSSTLRMEASGGSAQFYETLELHLKSMQLSSGFQHVPQEGGSSPDSQETGAISNSSSSKSKSGGKSQQQAGPGTGPGDEKSNKPRRRLQTQIRSDAAAAAAAGYNDNTNNIITSTGGLSSFDSKDSGEARSWAELSIIMETATKSNASSMNEKVMVSSSSASPSLSNKGNLAYYNNNSNDSRHSSLAKLYTAAGNGNGNGNSNGGAVVKPSSSDLHLVSEEQGSTTATAASSHEGEEDKDQQQQQQLEQQQEQPKKKVVSLLAKGIKSMRQKDTWSNLLPTVNTVKRRGGPWGSTSTSSGREGSTNNNNYITTSSSNRGGIPRAPLQPQC